MVFIKINFGLHMEWHAWRSWELWV